MVAIRPVTLRAGTEGCKRAPRACEAQRVAHTLASSDQARNTIGGALEVAHRVGTSTYRPV